MIRFETDEKERSVAFDVPKALYSREGLRIAAHVFSPKAEVFLGESKSSFELTLKSKRGSVAAAELERLGGEFLNELLNQEYRFIVGRLNHKISNLIVTQTLWAARGGEKPPPPSPAEQEPEFKKAVANMMREAEDEIKMTMPKKIAPQGNPLPPAAEDAVV